MSHLNIIFFDLILEKISSTVILDVKFGISPAECDEIKMSGLFFVAKLLETIFFYKN